MSSRFFLSALAAALMLSFTGAASAAVIVITQSKAAAGNVTPGDPPGFPVILSQPGAYRLDSNLTVPAGKNGLHVTSNYVDIDMNGFRLWGWNAAGDTRVANNGVYSGFGFGTVRNGAISGFKLDGIHLEGVSSGGWAMEDLKIFGNGEGGIDAFDSDYHRLSRNSILRNNHDGITCGRFCLVEESVIVENRGDGIRLVSGTIIGNSLFSNDNFAIRDNTAPGDTGVGNNTLVGNNGLGVQQADGVVPLDPNACAGSSC